MSPARISSYSIFAALGDRPAQEDHSLVLPSKGIFVLADGFGGPLPGSEAAEGACEAVHGFLHKEAGDRDATLPFELKSYFSLAGNVLFNALIHANQKLLNANKNRNVHEKGGASVLAGFLDGDLLALANVGACSARIFRGGKSTELVVPRSYGRLLDPFAGSSSSSESRIPLTALGMAPDLEPEIIECRVRPGDWLVLYSDGFDEEAGRQIEGFQQQGLSSEETSKKVLEFFNSRHLVAQGQPNGSIVWIAFG